MGSAEPIGRTRCGECGGTGKTQDETPCPTCEGTGLVEVFKPPTVPEIPPNSPPRSLRRRRRFPRYYADLPIGLRDPQEREFAGRCVVIAEGGLAATLPEPICAGSVVTLRFAIPTHPTTLEVLAVVRNQLGLRHGFEFVSLTDSERAAVRQFCTGLMVQSEVEPVVP